MSQWSEQSLSQFFSNYDDFLERKFGFPAVCNALDGVEISSTVLDYGCGSGALTLHLINKGFQVVGVDISEHSLSQARDRFKGQNASFIHPDVLVSYSLNGRFSAAVSAFLFCTIEKKHEVISLLINIAKNIPLNSKFVVLEFNTMSTGVDFRTFQAGHFGTHYSDGDKLPVRMNTKNGECFCFYDTFWSKNTLISFALETKLLQFQEGLSFDKIIPNVDDLYQPFSLLSFKRI